MASSSWTFQNDNDPTYWELDTAEYVSPPSSLRLGKPSNNCWYDDDTLIREGRIETYFKVEDDTNPGFGFWFRSQVHLGFAKTYLMWQSQGVWHFYYFSLEGDGICDPLNGSTGDAQTYNADTWYRVRVTWWEGRNTQNVLATAARVDNYIGGDWVQQGVIQYHTGRLYEDSSTNMVGLHGADVNGKIWWDDTIIYQA